MKRIIFLLCLFLSISAGYAESELHWGSRPSYSPDGEKILFAAESGRKSHAYGESQIYVMDQDSSNITRLSLNGRNEQLPIYSSDGSKIAFVSQESELKDREIWIMKSDGSNRKQLTNNQFDDSCPAFSPDGTRIVFIRAIDYRPAPWGGWKWGSWGIYVMNVDGSGERSVSQESFYQMSCPYFSPDGETLLVSIMGLDGFDSNSRYRDQVICSVNLETGTITTIGDNDTNYPAFSPDGRKIVYQGRPYHREIFVMDSDGLNKYQITKEQRYNAHPGFSPDGKKILFLSDPEREDKDWRLYEVNVDGTDLRRISIDL